VESAYLLVRATGWRLVGLAQTPQGWASVHKEGTMNAIIELARAIKAWWQCYKLVRGLKSHGKKLRQGKRK